MIRSNAVKKSASVFETVWDERAVVVRGKTNRFVSRGKYPDEPVCTSIRCDRPNRKPATASIGRIYKK